MFTLVKLLTLLTLFTLLTMLILLTLLIITPTMLSIILTYVHGEHVPGSAQERRTPFEM